MRKLALHWQILIAILLAGVVGFFININTTDTYTPGIFGASFVEILGFFGTLFLNALKMIIIPLIVSSIIVGVAGIGSGNNLGRLGGKTLLFYAVTTTAAILIGLFVINVIQPGIQGGEPVGPALNLEAPAEEVQAKVGNRGVADVFNIFLRMVPDNVVGAAVDGNFLGLIFFAILFGFFMTRLSHEYSEPLYKFWDGVFHVIMKMTEWIMKFAPIGVFGLVAKVVAGTPSLREAAESLLIFSGAVVLALAIHAVVVLPLLLRFVGKVSPWKTFQGASKPMLMAFSTASSSGTLPVTMEAVEEKIGVSNNVSSFVLPLGATVNMNGTALYECAAAMFIAQAYGWDLGFGVQFLIVITALLTSIGVAGVPSASLVAIAIILKAVGLPMEAIGVLFVFDRILDMCRTSINVWGDTCCATIVARLEGEETNVAA
ncbi:MAG: dicarboxylate/amino acid:cation symporter [Pseudomonadota bacterium]